MIRRFLAGSSFLSRALRTPAGRVAKGALDRARRLRIALSLRRLSGPPRLSLGERDLVVLCIVRNGALQVRSFIEHHLDLGARWIVLVDNGSTDATLAMASEYPNVALWRCTLPLRPFEWLLRRHLVERFARDRWSLTLDIDERFDYPCSDRLPLGSLLEYLDHHGHTVVVTYMLDRFAAGPVGQQTFGPRDDPAKVYTHYDLSRVSRHPYHDFSPPSHENRLSDPNLQWYRGGIRKQAFGVDESITKQALIFCGRGTEPHPANHARGASVADVTGLLHHYKFLPDFREYVEFVVRKNVFPPDSIQYRRMLDRLNAEPELDLTSPTARVYGSTEQLVSEGFLVASQRFLDWVARNGTPDATSTTPEPRDASAVGKRGLPVGALR